MLFPATGKTLGSLMSDVSDTDIPQADERGRRCPAPVIALGLLAKASVAGSYIAVLSDDPSSEHDIPAWCRMRGATLVSVSPATADNGHGRRYLILTRG